MPESEEPSSKEVEVIASLDTTILRRRYTPSAKERLIIYQKTGGLCHICGGKLDIRWTADHVKPVAMGGESDPDNFLPACGSCNRLKWHWPPKEIRKIMQLGIYARKEIEDDTPLGRQIDTLYNRRETSNAGRRKPPRPSDMKPYHLVILLGFLLTVPLYGQTNAPAIPQTPPITYLETIRTVSGGTYSHCKIIAKDENGITIVYSGGATKISFGEMVLEDQAKFGINADKFKASQIEQAKQQAIDDANSQRLQQLKGAAAARENKYASLFAFPPKGDVGLLGHVMRIYATFDLQLTPEIVSVNFDSAPVEPYGKDYRGPQYPPIAVYGMPSSFADGSHWIGIVYPAGTITFGLEKYQLYATTKEAAMALLEQK